MSQHPGNSRVGVMSVVHEGRRPFGMQTYFFEDMVKGVPQMEASIFFFSPLDWNSESDIVPGYKYVDQSWRKVQETIPEIIYDRAFSSDNGQKIKISNCREYLAASNKILLNPFPLADLLNNKIEFHTFLMANKIPTLGTYPLEVLKEESFIESLECKKIYIKPTFGSKGQGIYVLEYGDHTYQLFDNVGKVQSFDSYSRLIDELTKLIGQENYFVQEGAKTEWIEDAPFDIRVLVQNYGDDYKVTGKALRIGQKKSMTSNLNSGGSALPIDELQPFFNKMYNLEVEDLHTQIDLLCLNCAEKLRNQYGEFCEIGFDILITKDKGPIIIEGNAKPSRWVFVNIADHLKALGKDNTEYLNTRKETVSVPMRYAAYLCNELH